MFPEPLGSVRFFLFLRIPQHLVLDDQCIWGINADVLFHCLPVCGIDPGHMFSDAPFSEF